MGLFWSNGGVTHIRTRSSNIGHLVAFGAMYICDYIGDFWPVFGLYWVADHPGLLHNYL